MLIGVIWSGETTKSRPKGGPDDHHLKPTTKRRARPPPHQLIYPHESIFIMNNIAVHTQHSLVAKLASWSLGIFTYSNVFMMASSAPLDAADVAAPMQKLWPQYLDWLIPTLSRAGPPDCPNKPLPREEPSVTIHEQGALSGPPYHQIA